MTINIFRSVGNFRSVRPSRGVCLLGWRRIARGGVSGGFGVSTDVSLLVVTCRLRGFEIMMIVLWMGCLGDVMIR